MKVLRKLCAEQVNILLDRMESHPDEFYKVLQMSKHVLSDKWDLVLNAGEFNLVEKYLIHKKMKELKRKATHQQILLTIMYGKEASEEDHTFHSTVGRFNQTDPNIAANRTMIVSSEMKQALLEAAKVLK
jgi:hypothetical protein